MVVVVMMVMVATGPRPLKFCKTEAPKRRREAHERPQEAPIKSEEDHQTAK